MRKIGLIAILGCLFYTTGLAQNFNDTNQLYGWDGTTQFYQTWNDHKAQLKNELSIPALTDLRGKEYSSLYEYDDGDIATSGHIVYVSLQDNNINHSVTDTSWWQQVQGGGGSGDVTKVGTPADNQVAIWTGDGTVKGDPNIIWDGSHFRIVGNGKFGALSAGDTDVSFSNSQVNFGKTTSNLGNEYDVLQYNKLTVDSTSNPGDNTVGIGLWQTADLLGGNVNHMVGLLGEALSSNSSTAATLIGNEGKVYANVDGSTVSSFMALTYLNATDNTNSVAYGLQSNVSALQGTGTGTTVAGLFNASGGGSNFDIMLAGAKNIAAWNSTFDNINYINFTDNDIQLIPAGGQVTITGNVSANHYLISAADGSIYQRVANTNGYTGTTLTASDEGAFQWNESTNHMDVWDGIDWNQYFILSDQVGSLVQAHDADLDTAAGADAAGNGECFGKDSSGTVGFFTPAGGGGSSLYIATPPTYSDEACTPGSYAFDANYIYDCVSSGDWNRVATTNWNNPAPVTYTLTVTDPGNNDVITCSDSDLSAAINCGNGNTVCTATAASGASITGMTATPSSGRQFDNWTGDITGTENPTTTALVMDADKGVGASFSAQSASNNWPADPTGATVVTVNSAGGGNYTSLAAFAADINNACDFANHPCVVTLTGSETLTANLVINASTNPTLTNNLVIRAADPANKYNIDCGNSDYSLRSSDPYVTFRGINIHGYNGDYAAVFISGYINNITVDSCEVHDIAGNGSGIYFYGGAHEEDGSVVTNNLIYNVPRAGISFSGTSTTTDVYVYNNTVYNSGTANSSSAFGIRVVNDSNLFHVKNNVVINSYHDYLLQASNDADYNIASDTTTIGANSRNSTTLSEISFVSTTSGSEDLHINSGSVAESFGTDVTGTITWDFDADSRSSTMDAGGDER